MKNDVEAARLIAIDDEFRTKERIDLLESATKHLADAYAFSCSGDPSDGYGEIVKVFNNYMQKPHSGVSPIDYLE
jgi:hypothetical protein